MNSNTWTVITFSDEQAVSAVPSSWLHEDSMCFWPSNFTNKQAVTAIETCQVPDPQTWKLYKYTGFRNNVYETYKEASQKAEKAMMTSELESDAPTNKRKKTDDGFGSSSQSDEDIILKKKKKVLPKMPVFKKSKVNDSRNLSVPVVTPNSPHVTPNRGRNINENESNSKGTFQMAAPGSAVTDKNDAEITHKYLETIIRKLNILQNTMSDFNKRIDLIEAKQVTSCTTQEETISLYVQVPYLPINCEKDLNQLETYLSQDDNMKNAVKEISLLGGSDIYDFINRATSKLITNRFCGAEYSFIGKREKKAFNVLNLMELLTQSAMKIFTTITVKDVELSIAKWIRRCTERGKKERDLKT